MRLLRQFKSILQLHLKVKQRTCSELSWFPKMPNPTRNAQTQHGEGSSVDVENIFLHRFMLTMEPLLEVNHIAGQDATASPGPEYVWFHNVTDIESAEKEDPEPPVSLSKELKEEPTSALEKRKAESTEDEIIAKKAKIDDEKERKIKRPGFSDERYDETSYYFENGLRKVYPYFFTFTTFAKGRWVDEKILDVFVREFRAAPPEEYERSLEAGKLTVNNEKVPKDYKIKHNDLLANVVHRHEVPVTSQPIKIVYMDKDIVVVNKPASIPVHPCGRYRHNTVVFILAKEYNLKNLRTIHRLDRLTSGLLLFGRTADKARELEQQIRTRQVKKEYVCRVEGHFPDGIVECCEPIDVVSYKIGVCRVSPKGKDCKTTFQRIGVDGDCSIVHCKPLTGRMHQIRVHLQYLGYPISNDPLYNHEVFGPLKGKGGDIGGISDEQLINNLISIHNAENWLGVEGEIKEDIKSTTENNKVQKEIKAESVIAAASVEEQSADASTQTCHEEPDRSYDRKKSTSDPHCHECKLNYREPEEQNLIMYLHAWKYKGLNWEYKTELPDWACKTQINYEEL